MKLARYVKRGVLVLILIILFSSFVVAVCKNPFVVVHNAKEEFWALRLQKALVEAGSDVTLDIERALDYGTDSKIITPLKLGPGAQRIGEKHILNIQELVKQGKFGSAWRYLEGVKPKVGRSGLILPEDAQQLEKFIQKAEAAQIKITSSIKDPGLIRAAEKAVKNEQVKDDLDHLILQLKRGNTKPGIGTKGLPGTDVSYSRTEDGARLFFRQTGEGYEIVGKSSKQNEHKVIARLHALYPTGKK